MRKAMWMVAVAAVAATTLGGCASLVRQAFKEPVVSLRNVQLNGLGLTGGELQVELGVYNPNGYRLDATRFNYQVQLDTVTFATGTLTDRLTFQEKDSTIVRIPVSFTYRGIGEAGRQVMNTGAVNYRVKGDVTVGTPVGNYTIPYNTTGRFSTLGSTR